VAPPGVAGQAVVAGQTNAMVGNPMVYILGTLFAILLLAGISLLLKKLITK